MRVFVSTLLVAAGCPDPVDRQPVPGIQIGEEGDPLGCGAFEVDVSDLDVAVGTLDFTARAFLQGVPAELSGTFTFADGSSEPLTLTRAVSQTVRHRTWEPLYTSTTTSSCPDDSYVVAFTGTLSTTTLGIPLAGDVRAEDPSRPWFSSLVPERDVQGAAPVKLQPRDGAEIWMDVAGWLEDGTHAGAATWVELMRSSYLDVEALGNYRGQPAR